MSGVKNNNVRKELEKLLAPLKESAQAEYNILLDLIDAVYEDPKINQPEASSSQIENMLYQWIDNSVNSENS
ncbi:hypothetical protein [Flavobacterium sp.]|uniref:hypothetical protein n=1 Tax=Flavobacterium sp. TaxID=239 RepID=UPI003918FA8A